MAQFDGSVTHPDARVRRLGEVIVIATSLFFSAMGANTFVQFVVPFLFESAGWPEGRAALVLIVAFGCMPAARLIYTRIERRLGDRNSLIAGNVLFLVFLSLIAWVDNPWAIIGGAPTLGMGAALVFTAGPLRILAITPSHQHSAASGVFFASNFLAWLAGVAIYGQVVRLFGFGPLPVVAMLPTLLGLLVAMALPHRAAETMTTSMRDFLQPLSSQVHRIVMLFMALSAFAFGLMFSTLAQYLTRTFGPANFSLGLLSFYLARLPGSLVAGALINRWGQRRVLAIIFGLSGMALLVVSAYSSVFAIVLAAVVVLGFQQATVPVAAMALAGTQTRVGARRAGYGLLFAAAELGVACSLVLAQAAGELLDNASHVFVVFGVVFMLGGLAAWRLRPHEAE